jgi:polar amino acid transport system substrate-binding protein
VRTPSLPRSVFVGVFGIAMALVISSVSLAQPQLPLHWFEERAPLSDRDSISFCVDPRDPGHVVDAAIAEAIASILLVNVRLHVIDEAISPEQFDELYFALVEHCSVHVGFRLYSDTYPEWLTITRGFYDSRFVVVTGNREWRTLADIPVDVPIGVVQGTLGDVRFLLANNAQRAAERRPRFPLGQPAIAFEALVEGRVGALVVWEPWWWWLRQSRPELRDLHVVDAPFVSDPPVGVGGVLLADRMALRASIDDAIAALVADGTIQGILESFEYPGLAR